MGLLSSAVPGSLWKIANGKTARYVKKGCDEFYGRREHTLVCVETGSMLYRYDHGGCSETFTEFEYNIVAPLISKYPTNGTRHGAA